MYKSTSQTATTYNVEQLKKLFQEVKKLTNVQEKEEKLIDITHGFFQLHEWDRAMEVIKSIPQESDRDFLIAEMIEEYLIPNGELNYAKECVKFLTPEHETTTLIQTRLAVLDGRPDKALEFANELPTPISRNYALYHIIQEYYLMGGDVENAIELGKQVVENCRSISNPLVQSQGLRNVVKNLFLEHGEYTLAKQVADVIPDASIKKQVLAIIHSMSGK